jgi:hypothetical protein
MHVVACVFIFINLNYIQMEITILNDRIIIDGNKKTVVYGKSRAGLNVEIDNCFANFYTDFVKVNGQIDGKKIELNNFIFIEENEFNDMRFGDVINIDGKDFRYIGIDKSGKRLLWNEKTKVLSIG